MMRTSEDSADETNHQPATSSDESESDDGDEPGEVMLTHPTALSFSFPHNHMLEQVA